MIISSKDIFKVTLKDSVLKLRVSTDVKIECYQVKRTIDYFTVHSQESFEYAYKTARACMEHCIEVANKLIQQLNSNKLEPHSYSKIEIQSLQTNLRAVGNTISSILNRSTGLPDLNNIMCLKSACNIEDLYLQNFCLIKDKKVVHYIDAIGVADDTVYLNWVTIELNDNNSFEDIYQHALDALKHLQEDIKEIDDILIKTLEEDLSFEDLTLKFVQSLMTSSQRERYEDFEGAKEFMKERLK